MANFFSWALSLFFVMSAVFFIRFDWYVNDSAEEKEKMRHSIGIWDDLVKLFLASICAMFAVMVLRETYPGLTLITVIWIVLGAGLIVSLFQDVFRFSGTQPVQ